MEQNQDDRTKMQKLYDQLKHYLDNNGEIPVATPVNDDNVTSNNHHDESCYISNNNSGSALLNSLREPKTYDYSRYTTCTIVPSLDFNYYINKNKDNNDDDDNTSSNEDPCEGGLCTESGRGPGVDNICSKHMRLGYNRAYKD